MVDAGGIAGEDLGLLDACMDERCGTVLDYYSGVSAGPHSAIILSPTTFRDHLNIGVSYRIAEFPRANIDAVMEVFRDQIEQPYEASLGKLRRLAAC